MTLFFVISPNVTNWEQVDDFICILFAHDERLYLRNGLRKPLNNTLRWSMIHEHNTLGIDQQSLEELMIKELGERKWPEGLADLLGYQF